MGRPTLDAETPIVLEGWGDLDGAWSTVRATHEITPHAGYTNPPPGKRRGRIGG